MNENLEENFIKYCCLFGLIGNTLTCFLLTKRITGKKFRKIKSNKKYDCNERKHNYAIYFYFIGICISDMVVLVNWLISKLNITAKLDTQLTFENENNNNQNVLISYNDFIEFSNNISVSLNLSNIKIFDQENTDTFLNNNKLINILNKQLQNYDEYVTIKMTNLQGICQLYNYFALTGLCSSFSFTLAALLDRLFKIEVIFNVFMRKNKKKPNETNNFEETLLANSATTTNTQNHSELIRQLFGKSSVFFIGIIVIVFHFHLLWIFGSLPSYVNQSRVKSHPISYKMNIKDEHINQGYFSIVKSRPDCTLLLTNMLPYYVFVFDLFILLVFSTFEIIISFMISKVIKKQTSLVQQEDDGSKILKFKELFYNSFINVKCIIFVSIFTFILNMPPLIARIMLMIVFASSNDDKNENIIIINQNYTNININNSNSSFIKESNQTTSYGDYFLLLSSICNKLDLLLLLSSSHKFFVFITQCHLVKLPFWLKKFFSRRLSC